MKKSQRKLKLLCMHGYGTNKQFMKMQTKAISSQLAQITEFIYIDGPIIVPKQTVFDPIVFKYIKGDARSWFNHQFANKAKTLKESLSNLQLIRVAIESEGTVYDGALCFSEGMMAFQGVYLFHKLRYIRWQSFTKLKFVINFSSVALSYSLSYFNWQRFQIPSLHILSDQDRWFQSMMLTVTRFKDPEFIIHAFGHKIPPLSAQQKKKIIAFIKKHGYSERNSYLIDVPPPKL